MHNFKPAGFFVMRTPLLPLHELVAWSEGLAAPAALTRRKGDGATGRLPAAKPEVAGEPGDAAPDPPLTESPARPLAPSPPHPLAGGLEQALGADRDLLRARLREAISRPEVRDALFVASPDLDSAIDLWMREPESEKGQRAERALVRYYQRMTARATPFGLFAGGSVGTIGPETDLALGERGSYQRHTRLDMDYLFALVEALAKEPEIRSALRYRPNSSLYRAASRLRYVEARLDDKKNRSYHLVTVDETEYLTATLNRSSPHAGTPGAPLADLTAALVTDEIAREVAEAYVQELVESQILVPEIALPVTGPEPIHPLIEQLGQYAEAKPVAAALDRARAALAAIDAEGLGVEPDRYRAIARELEALPAKVELPRLFQVDLVKPAPGATLGADVVAEIQRGVETLHRLAGSHSQENLKRFCDAFTERYEGREVPLAEALDDEAGVGFRSSGGPGADASPLLKGLHFPGSPDETTSWGKRQALLFRKFYEALARGETEIVLEKRDLEGFETGECPPLPDSFAAPATVAAASPEALARGEFRILLGGASGPSGARLLGRFCHADEALERHVRDYLAAEEAQRPEAAFAEIVHLPEGRLGNILCRPVLRGYEIPYLGWSSAPLEKQIPITDLMVSVQGQRIVLRSRRLGQEVVPRLTSAHNYSWRALSIYRFVCMLQGQGVAAGLGWDWGVLEGAPFLPRVSMGRLVLSLAHWNVNREELKRLGEAKGTERFRAVQEWRAERRLPRCVALTDADNLLPVDFDNILSVEAFVHLVKDRGGATLTEIFPGPSELLAHGPSERFTHELIVPFVRRAGDAHGEIDDWKLEIENRKLAERRGPNAEGRTANAGGHHGQQVALTEGRSSGNLQSSISNLQSSISPPQRRRFPPGTEWLYAKLYTGAATTDHVLREVVAPLVEQVTQSGAADRWFFIRYGDPEWHLRLRFHGEPQRLHAEVLPALQEAAAGLLDEGQGWRFQIDTYEREVERYGGPEGMILAEQLFHADSEAVLEIVQMLERGDAGLDERWRLCLRGMDMLLADLGFDLEGRQKVMAACREGFAREFNADKGLKAQLGERFRKERASLTALLDPANDAESPLAPGLEVFQRRSTAIAPIAAELRALEQSRRLTVPVSDLAGSYLHMHANRLLRSSQRAQETVLYDFLARLYQSRVAGGGNRQAAVGQARNDPPIRTNASEEA